MTTNILCRFDSANNRPVVFIADTINEKEITAWSGGKRFKTTLDYYHQTLPLSQADNIVLRNQFATATKDNDVIIRNRLPRKNRMRPNLIATPQQQALAKMAQSMPGAPSIAPQEKQRRRNRKDVPNRLSVAPTPTPQVSHAVPSSSDMQPLADTINQGFQFDIAAAIAGVEQEMAGKLAAIKRAAGLN